MTTISKVNIFDSKLESVEPKTGQLIVKDGSITHVGYDRSSAQETGQADDLGAETNQDYNGKVLIPAFCDAHMHILLFAASLHAIDIQNCHDLEAIQNTIKDAARSSHASSADNPRLMVQGWMNVQTDSLALAKDLDHLDDHDRPIYVYAKDLHSAWLNTAALKEIHAADLEDPPGGTILRDETGSATGLFSEAAAISLVWPHLNKITLRNTKLSQMRDAFRVYNEAGYTSLIEMATDSEIWSLLHELYTSPTPPKMRVACHWLIRPSKTDGEALAQVHEAIGLHKIYNQKSSNPHPNLRITGIKLILDGVVDACTATLREPYTDTHAAATANSDPIWTYEQLLPIVELADSAGLQCALHAIGDKAVNIAVNALEAAGTPGARHRIEHLELTSPEDAKRLGQLGITASVQPVHSDPSIFTEWWRLIGQHRCARAFAYKDFLDGGANVALGTDSPTAPHLPLSNLYIASTRRSAKPGWEERIETVNEQFRLTMAEAIRGATLGGAYSCFNEKAVGSIEVGKRADFVVLELAWTPEGFLTASVRETWMDGECIFRAAER